MRIFLLSHDKAGNSEYSLTKKEQNYLMKVLRLTVGQELTARDKAGSYYTALITSPQTLLLTACGRPEESLTDSLSAYRGPLPRIILHQCLCKGKKNEDIVRMATEAGVEETVFLTSAFTQDKAMREHDRERIETIMREAVMQSGSETAVAPVRIIPFEEAVSSAPGRIIMLHQGARTRTMLLSEALEGLDASAAISLFVGSEGGFSDAECAFAEAHGAFCCLMPTNILRAETAGIFAIGAIENILCCRHI